MIFALPSNKLPFTLLLGITTKSAEKILISAKDYNKKDTYYTNRCAVVNGYREFELKFPQTPKVLLMQVYNQKKGNFKNDEDKSFEITKFEVKELKTCPLWQDSKLLSFVKLAQEFSENASILSAGDYKPSIYRSDDGEFCIDYYQKIRDHKTGGFSKTPARIGHNTGVIEVSKSDFSKYTVPMRMVILLHEYSHKWMNPKSSRDISDEVGADVNALNIYLSLGYPTMEAQYAFLKIFRHANNKQNHQRYLILDDFIKKFTSGRLTGGCNTGYAAV